jgi:Putative amidoligase enzyme
MPSPAFATVSQVFGTTPVQGMFGVEIEVEGNSLPHPSTFINWRVESDGSLRGESAEYVLASPMNLDGVEISLAELRRRFTENNTNINSSIRAGIHIHVNVNDLTIPQLFSFLTCYYLVEALITRKAGHNRAGNLFALRLEDAYGTIPYIVNFLKSGDISYLGNNNSIRYAACNLSSLSKYGSVEFRQLGTSKDFDVKIKKWCELLGTIRTNSLRFSSPREIIYSLSGEGANNFVTSILSRQLADEFIFTEPDYIEKIMEYSRYVQDYVFCITEETMASTFSLESVKPLKKHKLTLNGREIQWEPHPTSMVINRTRPAPQPLPDHFQEINDDNT